MNSTKDAQCYSNCCFLPEQQITSQLSEGVCVETVLPNYGDQTFASHFRMSKANTSLLIG